MIYMIKQGGLYQSKVKSSLISTCNCKIGYWKINDGLHSAPLCKLFLCYFLSFLFFWLNFLILIFYETKQQNRFIFKARLKSLRVNYLVNDTFIDSGKPTFVRLIRHFIKSLEIFRWCFLNSWATFVNKICG